MEQGNNMASPFSGSVDVKSVHRSAQSAVSMGVAGSGVNIISSKKKPNYVFLIISIVILLVFGIVFLLVVMQAGNGFFGAGNNTTITPPGKPNPTLNTGTITLAPSETPNLPFTTENTTMISMPGFKMTMEIPSGWSYKNEYTGTKQAGVIDGYLFYKNGEKQFSFIVGDGGIIDSNSFCQVGQGVGGSSIKPIEITIVGKKESIRECFLHTASSDPVGPQFDSTYSQIDSFRFIYQSNLKFTSEFRDILSTIKYTGESHNNIK